MARPNPPPTYHNVMAERDLVRMVTRLKNLVRVLTGMKEDYMRQAGQEAVKARLAEARADQAEGRAKALSEEIRYLRIFNILTTLQYLFTMSQNIIFHVYELNSISLHSINLFAWL